MVDTRSNNRLLESLPARDLERLWPHLQSVQLSLRQPIHEPLAPLRYAYFVEQGLISVVNTTTDGATIEVATIGSEGMTGLPILMGVESTPQRYLVQIEGTALRLPANVLRDETRTDTPLRRLLHRYQVAFSTQIMQSVTCNGLHSIQQRCCRWLLRCLDRTTTPEVTITHEFLAQMLGVRRASVSDVLRPLQDQGMIRHRRGVVAVLDRPGLELASCECYSTINREFERLIRTPD